MGPVSSYEVASSNLDAMVLPCLIAVDLGFRVWLKSPGGQDEGWICGRGQGLTDGEQEWKLWLEEKKNT